MRDDAHPGGFDDLPLHRREQVRLGHALAEISKRLAEAKERAGNFWTLEQPATSLMWLFDPIAQLISRFGIFIVTTDVCMFGAPWRKPTSISANFIQILKLRRVCSGQHEHISLQGNAPCGRSWTAVASPYWPEFAKQWVGACYTLFLLAGERLPPLHFAGFAPARPELTVEELLDDMRYSQPQGRESSTTALRVGAGLQPAGRAMPQLLPDGLGPLDHIRVALATVHPLARPPSVPVWCKTAFEAQKKGISNMKVLKRKVKELLVSLATLCWDQSQIIAEYCHDWIRPTIF